jgi:hypothetical protein
VVDSSGPSDDSSVSGDEINMGKLPVNLREAALWFSQPVFAGVILSSDEEG